MVTTSDRLLSEDAGADDDLLLNLLPQGNGMVMMIAALRELGCFGGDGGRCSASLPKLTSGEVFTNVLAGLVQSSESYGQVYTSSA